MIPQLSQVCSIVCSLDLCMTRCMCVHAHEDFECTGCIYIITILLKFLFFGFYFYFIFLICIMEYASTPKLD